MAAPKFAGNAIELMTTGTALPVGTHVFGPFTLGGFRGFLLDMVRSDDGTNGTCTVTLKVDDVCSGTRLDQLDGAGAAIVINDWAAGENVRRQLQVHPDAGPMPFDDADGVFQVGTTGVASSYYRQPVQDPFSFSIAVATDASTFTTATLHLLR